MDEDELLSLPRPVRDRNEGSLDTGSEGYSSLASRERRRRMFEPGLEEMGFQQDSTALPIQNHAKVGKARGREGKQQRLVFVLRTQSVRYQKDVRWSVMLGEFDRRK